MRDREHAVADSVEIPPVDEARGVSKPPAPATGIALRRRLLVILLMAGIPLLVFFLCIAVLLAREQRGTIQRGAMEGTRALLTAVDTELERSVAALEVLAASRHLAPMDLEAFRAQTRRVLSGRVEWHALLLSEPGADAARSLLDGDEGRGAVPASVRAATARLAHRGSAVGQLFLDPRSGRHLFSVSVSVRDGGSARYALTALVDPVAIQEILRVQGLPDDWVGVVLDQDHTIVARSVGFERIGRPAAPSLRAALDGAGRGWFRGATLEGWAVYTPFARSTLSGWTVALGLPAAYVDGPLRRTLAWLGGAALVVLALSFGIAWSPALRATRALEDLASRAEDLGRGRNGSAPVDIGGAGSGIREVEELRDALQRAAELLAAREAERDRVERSLRDAEASLREGERRKDEFLAMLGHELRNPLSVVRTALHLLGPSAPAGCDGREAVGMIDRQVAHMTKLLDELLDVVRIAQGRIEVNLRHCDLVQLVRTVAEDHRAALADGGLELDIDVPEQPLWVRGDRTRLAQALGNLLQNASKYTEAGGRVQVRLVEERDGTSARLTVEDTGLGMDPEMLACAFEPFRQADRTIARSRGGLGLGLSVVRHIVERHGGSVRAASDGPDRGTTIEVVLPLEHVLRSPDALPEAAPRIEARPLSVVVVEDNEMAARSMQLYLEGRGHTVAHARTGRAGIAAARELRPDLVLCDIGLPDADGYEVARALRAEASLAGLHIVAVSGYGQESDRRRARQAGFDAHFTKPVDLVELCVYLARVADGVSPGAELAPA